jgi:hypothetical protein
MNERTKRDVRERADARCEYCQLIESSSPLARLQIEHVRPKKHGGSDAMANLALACIDCNLRKGVNLTGVDPLGGEIAELFNPREQVWTDHFVWDGLHILGLSPIVRATVNCLNLNSPDRMMVRLATH